MALSELPLHHSFRLSSRPNIRRLLQLLLLVRRRRRGLGLLAFLHRRQPHSHTTTLHQHGRAVAAEVGALGPLPSRPTSRSRSVPDHVHRPHRAPPPQRLGDLLDRSWARPDRQFAAASLDDDAVLPWERDDEPTRDEEDGGAKRRRVKAPTLAELTIDDEELRRLRRLGMSLRDRITVPKAGVTTAVTEKVHDAWRKSELVRLKFHEDLAHDMKTGHELVERRTGGLIIWRSGSVMVVYRGSNYKRPLKSEALNGASSSVKGSEGALFIPDSSSPAENDIQGKSLAAQHANMSQLDMQNTEDMTEEELELNQMLDELGPRFVDWWDSWDVIN